MPYGHVVLATATASAATKLQFLEPYGSTQWPIYIIYDVKKFKWNLFITDWNLKLVTHSNIQKLIDEIKCNIINGWLKFIRISSYYFLITPKQPKQTFDCTLAFHNFYPWFPAVFYHIFTWISSHLAFLIKIYHSFTFSPFSNFNFVNKQFVRKRQVHLFWLTCVHLLWRPTKWRPVLFESRRKSSKQRNNRSFESTAQGLGYT